MRERQKAIERERKKQSDRGSMRHSDGVVTQHEEEEKGDCAMYVFAERRMTQKMNIKSEKKRFLR